MEYIKLKYIAKYPTGKLNSNEACEDGRYPFFTCSHELYYINKYSYDGEYVLLGGNNASGDFPIFYYYGKFDAYQRTYLIQPINESQYNTRYLYYSISLKLRQMKNNAAGTATKFLTKPILNNILIESFSIEQQKRIADILSKYDELIEVNNKRIKILEQTAEELYKEWFVRFRFPGHETTEIKNSAIGKIPISFNVLRMSDVIDYYIGGGWGEENENDSFPQKAFVIRGTDFPQVAKGDLSTIPLRYHKQSNYKSRKLIEDDIVIEISGGTAEQPVGRTVIISKNLLNRLDDRVICASFCKLMRLNKGVVSPLFFYYWMKFLYDTRIIERYQLQSTGIINFKFEYFLKKCEVLMPPKCIMLEFEKKVKSIHEQIDLISTQNENLIKQRDLLLPRLMSGKLEV